MSEVLSVPPSVDGHDTVLVLPNGYSGSDVARQCRETAVQFMNESSRWGKAELAMWLSGPYALLTKHAKKVASEPTIAGDAPLIKGIDVRLVDRIIRTARTEVYDALAQVCADQSSSFVLRALISGLVLRVEDGYREPAWAPAAGTTRLADRVLSLFAVDYLVRPGDYENDLAVCPTCAHVAFDALARKRGYCALHTPQPARKGLTMPYPGLPLEA